MNIGGYYPLQCLAIGTFMRRDIPVLLFAARFRKKESRIEYQVYNGLVLMDVGNLADREEAVEVKRLASLAPQTMAAFVGSSGRA